jgi:hypothetical protein
MNKVPAIVTFRRMTALDIDRIEKHAKRVTLCCIALMAPWVIYTAYIIWSFA